MEKSGSRIVGYLLAAALGATAGGLAVALGSKAIPNMMSRMMAAVMENMRAQIGGEGCDPEEM
jgi:biopolymer transport protein ExbB/TolQ